MEQVEVRIPTYKRNDMLSSCLDSLIAQSWSNWKAFIFDDANDVATREVILSKKDGRFIYRPNSARLGAAANLNQCFQTKGYKHCSDYACCLEDDNWLYPYAIETNVETLRSQNAHIMMRNQDIFARSGAVAIPTGESTILKWFQQARFYEPVELAVRSIFYTGISNGALFWRTDAKSNLQDPYFVVDPSLQEYIRCWQMREPVYVRLDPALAYSDPCDKTHRHYTTDKSFSRALQLGHNRLLKKYGKEFISEAHECAKLFGKEHMLSQCFSNIATLHSLAALRSERLPIKPIFVLRGLFKRFFVESPIRGYQ